MSSAGQGVCFVSTFPPQRCGIGTYTATLAKAIARESGETPVVLSELGAASGTVEGVRSVPCFDRRHDYVGAIVAEAERAGARVVHVQHAPDIFGMDERLPRLLEAVRERGMGAAITLHTVHTPLSGALERRFRVARFHRRIADAADVLVVHGSATMADELLRQGVPAGKIDVLPHGTTLVQTPDPAESRRLTGLPPEGPILLYFGFIHIQKNLHTILCALARLRRRAVKARLVLAGSIQNRAWYNRAYLWACKRLIGILGIEESVILREGFVPSEAIPALYGAADVVLVPYAQRYGSASGVVHSALGAGRVLLCSRSPKFAEVGENVSPSLLVDTHSPSAWAERLKALLEDETERQTLAARILAYATETAWPKVAERHLALYGRLREANGTTTPLTSSALSRSTT